MTSKNLRVFYLHLGGFHNQIDVSWGACKKPFVKVRRTGSVLKSFLTSQPREKSMLCPRKLANENTIRLYFWRTLNKWTIS